MEEMKMDELIAGFSEQLREALQIGSAASLRSPDREIRNIVVTGLGGSGIGGNLASEFLADELKIPMEVNKGYFIPSYVDAHTLLIVSSYSGNTEETLNALALAEKAGAWILCVSSNGKVLERAREMNYDFIQVPGGLPPRACLGYSLVQQLYILHRLGFSSDRAIRDIALAADQLDRLENEIRTDARELADFFHGRMPVLYVCDQMASVAVRVRQQINENAKMLCWHHVIPEMNHNELVGWRDENENLAVLFLRNDDDYERNRQRIELNKEIVGRYTPHVRELWSKGENLVQRALYLIHLTDWMSFYLAGLHGVDPVEVRVIDFLKGELGKKQ